MPVIRKSADLRNKYSEISTFCHQYKEPVFITKNGEGDLAVMSIDVYEELTCRYKLYEALQIGLDQVKNGEVIPGMEMMKKIKEYAGKQMFGHVFSQIADLDIDQSYSYIKDTLEAPMAAENLFSELYEKINEVLENPYKRALVQDKYLASLGIRSINIKNYVLYYTIDEKQNLINFLRFLHQLRDRITILKGSIEDLI